MGGGVQKVLDTERGAGSKYMSDTERGGGHDTEASPKRFKKFKKYEIYYKWVTAF